MTLPFLVLACRPVAAAPFLRVSASQKWWESPRLITITFCGFTESDEGIRARKAHDAVTEENPRENVSE
jgi:hypothetical protein